jgi:flagellar motility protein MotE (MotC chaperone)
MGSFVEKIMMVFLIAVIAILSIVIVIMGDYMGFIDLKSKFPDVIKNSSMGQKYLRGAKISAMSPRDRQQALLTDKERYVEVLLQRVKLESLKIHEEKQKLENLFKIHEEEKLTFKNRKKRFKSNEKKIADQRAIQRNSELEDRLDTLAITYAKMDAKKAADIINLGDADESFQILKRMKPKTLGKILESLKREKAQELVTRMQQEK